MFAPLQISDMLAKTLLINHNIKYKYFTLKGILNQVQFSEDKSSYETAHSYFLICDSSINDICNGSKFKIITVYAITFQRYIKCLYIRCI